MKNQAPKHTGACIRESLVSDLSSLALEIEGQEHAPCRLAGGVNAVPSYPPVRTVKKLVWGWGDGSVDKVSRFGSSTHVKARL